ncbi:MAG: hypothetical protein ABEK02_07010 [Haloquadratum sp.]
MDTGGGADATAVGTTVAVTTALDELKSRGSALLVVGAVPEETYARVSGRMLGNESDQQRRRLIVEQPPGREARTEGIDRWTPEWTQILRFDVDARGAAADASPGRAGTQSGGGRGGPSTDTQTPGGVPLPDDPAGETVPGTPDDHPEAISAVEGSIADLGLEVSAAIDRFDAVAGGLAPAELRVAFDCVTSLLSEYDEATVFRFLHVLATQIRTVDGMGHVRLPKPLDSQTVRLLSPIFDAVVELRLDGSDPQQRWHFRDSGIASEWLPIEARA